MAFATFGEFTIRKGDVPTDEEGTVEALLEDASALIIAEAPGAEWDEEAPALIKSICVEVAYRAWSNPDALTNASIGAVATTYARDIPQAMFLTEEEVRSIRKAAGLSGVVSMTLVTPFSGDDAGDDDAGDL